jgi:hypothetical protein
MDGAMSNDTRKAVPQIAIEGPFSATVVDGRVAINAIARTGKSSAAQCQIVVSLMDAAFLGGLLTQFAEHMGVVILDKGTLVKNEPRAH